MTSQVAVAKTTRGFAPTREQLKARDLFLTRKNIKVIGCAGSAKTTTLELLGSATPRRGYYLAFNKSIATEAKRRMPRNVTAMTTHSLALRAVGHAFPETKLFARSNANAVAQNLSLSGINIGGRPVTARQQAACIISTVDAFCNSGDEEIGPQHVRLRGALLRLDAGALEDAAARMVVSARRLWDRMIDPDDPLPLGHHYMKLWSLAAPRIQTDFLLVDEAQDSNECLIRVLEQQGCQIVYVGDPAQQIFAFRGAVDAMDRMPADHTAYLSQSFRFGDALADLANIPLALLERDVPIVGNPTLTTEIGPVLQPSAVLCRTNFGVMSEVVKALDASKVPHVIGGTDDLKYLLEAVRGLRNNVPSNIPELFGYRNWREVEDAVREDSEPGLDILVKLVDEHGEEDLLKMLGKTVNDELDSTIVLSTAHKSKGREWPSVCLADDFEAPESVDRSTGDIALDYDEIKLLYVAMTRAKESLDVCAPVAKFLESRKEEADHWWDADPPPPPRMRA